MNIYLNIHIINLFMSFVHHFIHNSFNSTEKSWEIDFLSLFYHFNVIL